MVYRTKVQDDWIPVPAAVLRQMNWPEGTHLEVEISGDALIVSRAADQTNPPKPGARVKSRPLPPPINFSL